MHKHARKQTHSLVIPSIMYDAAIWTPTNHRIKAVKDKIIKLYQNTISM